MIRWNTNVNAQCCPGEIVDDETGQTSLIQSDYDYPSVASSFGWWIGSVQVCHRCGASLDSPDDSHENLTCDDCGDMQQPCPHRSTDGTIDCPDCKISASDFIASADQWLAHNDGITADDDLGYFTHHPKGVIVYNYNQQRINVRNLLCGLSIEEVQEYIAGIDQSGPHHANATHAREWFGEIVEEELEKSFKESGGYPALVSDILFLSHEIEYHPVDTTSETDEPTIDCRLRYHNGIWFWLTGSSDYDQDHRGYWGCSSVGGNESIKSANVIANSLFNQVVDNAAQ